jgi:hypothetical protein
MNAPNATMAKKKGMAQLLPDEFSRDRSKQSGMDRFP